MNEFSKLSNQTIIGCQYRPLKRVVVITFENEDVAYMHRNALENAFPFILSQHHLPLLCGATCYYKTSIVAKDEEFTWTGTVTPEDPLKVADKDLVINRVSSIFFKGDHGNTMGQYIAENFKGRVTDDQWEDAKLTKADILARENSEPTPDGNSDDTTPVLTVEELNQILDSIANATSLADLKAIVNSVESFADHTDTLLKHTRIKPMQDDMRSILGAEF